MRHFREQGTAISERDIFLVEVAGLCHDLGHGPFSHTFEDAFTAMKGITWKHEEASCALLEMINNRAQVLTAEELEKVKNMIRGNDEGVPKEQRFMYRIVANKRNSIDVDKFDYLQRDCHSSHLPLGMTNIFYYFCRLLIVSSGRC